MNYTKYHLVVLKGSDYKTNYRREISEAAGYDDCFDERKIKWRNMERDMREYSKKHPEVLFEIYGTGKRNGNIWKEYYLNGKMQKEYANITFDKFDEKKLV
jgi:hypothetical protein